MKKTVKVLKIIGNILLWLFVAFSVAITVLVLAAQNDSDGMPAIGGKCIVNILTPSMSGTLEPGDMIVCDKLTSEEKFELKVQDEANGVEGDIITYKVDLNGDGNTEFNTHRIVGANYDESGNLVSFITQGDNRETNPVPDENPVSWQLVVAKYSGVRFSGIGNFLSFLQTSTGFLVCILLPLLLFFGFELYNFIVAVIAVKNTGKKQITAADEELIKQKAIEEYLKKQAEQQAANDTPDEKKE